MPKHIRQRWIKHVWAIDCSYQHTNYKCADYRNELHTLATTPKLKTSANVLDKQYSLRKKLFVKLVEQQLQCRLSNNALQKHTWDHIIDLNMQWKIDLQKEQTKDTESSILTQGDQLHIYHKKIKAISKGRLSNSKAIPKDNSTKHLGEKHAQIDQGATQNKAISNTMNK